MRKGGLFGPINQKPSHKGLVLANKKWVGCQMGRGNPIGAVYTRVEVLEWCDRVMHKGGLFGPINQKPSHKGSVLANKKRVGC